MIMKIMPSVARNTFYLTSALVGQKLLSFVYFTLLARALGAEMIGKYTFALAFTTIFSIITDLGLTPVLIRETARAKERARELLATILWIKIFLTLAAYSAVLIAAYARGYPTLTLQLIALAGAVMVLDAFHLIFWGVLRGLQNLKYEAVGMVMGQGITLVGGIVALVLHLPLHAFLIALGLGSVWNVLYSRTVLIRQGLSLRPRLNAQIIRTFIRYAIPFALAGIFVKVYSYIDTVLLQELKGDLEVGWYSVPYKITYAFQFFPMALSAAVYPALANTWIADKARARWIFDRAMLYAILLGLPIAFGIAALAPEIILTIYGREFSNSILPLQISIFGLIFIFLVKEGFDGHAAKGIIQKEKIEKFIRKIHITKFWCWIGLILGILIFRVYINQYLLSLLGFCISGYCGHGVLMLTRREGEIRGYFRGYEECKAI